jgi:hypothetical protein
MLTTLAINRIKKLMLMRVAKAEWMARMGAGL